MWFNPISRQTRDHRSAPGFERVGISLDTLKFSIVRDKIVLKEGEAQSHIFEPEKSSSELPSLKHRIGVIKLPSFYVDFNDRRKIPTITKAPPET